MSKLAFKIAVSIILAGVFTIIIFMAFDYQQLSPDFYIIVLLLTFYVFFFGFAIGQNYSSPIKKLLDRATELSKGNLSSRVYLETKDELSELARVFNKIAEELEASRGAEANSEKTVDIKVKARTRELEETINALDQKIKNRTIELERLVAKSGDLESQAKAKEAEAIGLKQELNDLRSKFGPKKQ